MPRVMLSSDGEATYDTAIGTDANARCPCPCLSVVRIACVRGHSAIRGEARGAGRGRHSTCAAELAARTRPYMEFRTANFLGWHPTDHSMLIATRFANTNQVHRVARPDGARQQLTFEEDRIADASHAHGKGDVTVVMKDVGGDEFFQLYTLANGRLSLLTDGKSRNEFGAWSRDGKLVGYSSTRRNGTDTDLYVMDPRDREDGPPGRASQGRRLEHHGFLPGQRQRARRSN